MKTKFSLTLCFILLHSPFILSSHAQGTQFTYQGRLNAGTNPATGSYDLTFALFSVGSGAGQVGNTITNPATAVSNGLFNVVLDFGANFPGADRWLEIGVCTNGNGAFTTLAPRQKITPTPYAIMSTSASNLLGTLPANQLSGTPNAAVNFTGNLNGDVTGTQSATVVSTVNGQTAANVAAGVSAANAATTANTPNTIVKRDASGNFAAGSVTLAGSLNLPAVPATINSGAGSLLRADAAQNFFAGLDAGKSITSGGHNTANGFEALFSITGGFNNTASGMTALHANTTGDDNTANGYAALNSNTIGNYNTANGSLALLQNTAGLGNTASGAQALHSNTIGNYNTANGYQALQSNTSGNDNTANGFGALFSNTIGGLNTANGALALISNTNGSENTANGFEALVNNTSGDHNTASGSLALLHNITGSANTASGAQALYSNTNGANNTANGYQALYFNTTGTDNTASGYQSLHENTSGNNNTASGYAALYSDATGSGNTSMGHEALDNNTNGSFNIALGFLAGHNLTTGGNNILIGNQGVDGDNNQIYIGTQGSQTGAFMAGIYGTTASGSTPVYINSAGQLGTVASLPAITSVIGNADITVSAVNGTVSLGDTATNANIPNTIVKRNSDGGFSAGTVTIANGNVGVGTNAPQALLNVNGMTRTKVLSIIGGSDVAEPFTMSSGEIPKGAVVVIDDAHPGQLKLSAQAYDKRVAGIVSGAGGVNPGLTLSQHELTESGQNVALTGRVYALADAASGPIQPGDLLTTSAIPGHAMRVSNSAKAQGAILGKAMSRLESGRGLVLVLVTLQ